MSKVKRNLLVQSMLKCRTMIATTLEVIEDEDRSLIAQRLHSVNKALFENANGTSYALYWSRKSLAIEVIVDKSMPIHLLDPDVFVSSIGLQTRIKTGTLKFVAVDALGYMQRKGILTEAEVGMIHAIYNFSKEQRDKLTSR